MVQTSWAYWRQFCPSGWEDTLQHIFGVIMRLKRKGFFSDMVGKKVKRICISKSCERGSLGQINPRDITKGGQGPVLWWQRHVVYIHTIEMCNGHGRFDWAGTLDTGASASAGFLMGYLLEKNTGNIIQQTHCCMMAVVSGHDEGAKVVMNAAVKAPLDQESNT